MAARLHLERNIMITSIYQKALRLFLLASAFFTPAIAMANIFPFSSNNESGQLDKEFSTYEWICNLTQNEYDYVHTLHNLKLAIHEYETAYQLITVGSFFLAATIFLALIFSGVLTKGYRTAAPVFIVLGLSCIAPTYILINADQYLQSETASVNDLKSKLASLEPTNPKVILICKPDRPNVRISVENQTNS